MSDKECAGVPEKEHLPVAPDAEDKPGTRVFVFAGSERHVIANVEFGKHGGSKIESQSEDKGSSRERVDGVIATPPSGDLRSVPKTITTVRRESRAHGPGVVPRSSLGRLDSKFAFALVRGIVIRYCRNGNSKK